MTRHRGPISAVAPCASGASPTGPLPAECRHEFCGELGARGSVRPIDRSASAAAGQNSTATAKQDSDNHPDHPDNDQRDGPMTPS